MKSNLQEDLKLKADSFHRLPNRTREQGLRSPQQSQPMSVLVTWRSNAGLFSKWALEESHLINHLWATGCKAVPTLKTLNKDHRLTATLTLVTGQLSFSLSSVIIPIELSSPEKDQ